MRPTVVNSYSDSDLAAIDAELKAEQEAKPRAPHRVVGWVLLVGGLLGFLSSLALSVDKISLLENPGAKLGCDINPLISCGTFIQTWQASTFGFPNMFIGLGGYAIMAAIGSLYLSKVALPRWFQWATFGGLAFAYAFIIWLASNALFAIHALCPWCLLAWAVTAPMFFVYVAHLVEEGVFDVQGLARRVLRSWWLLALAWYVLVIALATIVFFPQWVAMAS